MSKSNEHTILAIKAAAIYAVFGGLWILLSDRILGLIVTDMDTYASIQTYKGWAYVVITALLVFKVFQGYLRELIEVRDMLTIEEERYQLAMRGSNIGTWDWDMESGDVVFNDQYTQMLGYEVDTFPPIYDSWEATLHPDDKKRTIDRLQDHLEGKTDEYSAEFRMLTADRQWKWIQAMGRVCRRDDKGRPLRMVGTHMDLTRQKESQSVLQAAKETAEAAKSTRDHFFANMGHEIRTPLNSIFGMLRLLRDSELTPDQKDMLANAEASSANLLTVVNELMASRDPESLPMRMCREELDINTLLESVERIFRTQLENLGIQLQFKIEPTAPTNACGDQDKIRQILFNLVSSAFHFSPKSAVNITVEGVRDPREEGCQLLLVSVEDDGHGLTIQEVETIFDTFAGVSDKDNVGVSLRIASRLIRSLRGTMCVDSDTDSGTLVAFTIPTHADKGLPLIETEPEQRQDITSQLHLLLAEDDPINRIVARRFLEKLGHSVTETVNGAEALKALRQESFDCVLMDIRMPVMDGRDAATAIRNDDTLESGSSIPIIAVTAHTAEDTKELKKSGFNGYIEKPITLDALKAELERVLGQK